MKGKEEPRYLSFENDNMDLEHGRAEALKKVGRLRGYMQGRKGNPLSVV